MERTGNQGVESRTPGQMEREKRPSGCGVCKVITSFPVSLYPFLFSPFFSSQVFWEYFVFVPTPDRHHTIYLVLHCTALYCTFLNMIVLHWTKLCCIVQYWISLNIFVLYCTSLPCKILYCTTMTCKILYLPALPSAALPCTALHCTALRTNTAWPPKADSQVSRACYYPHLGTARSALHCTLWDVLHFTV